MQVNFILHAIVFFYVRLLDEDLVEDSRTSWIKPTASGPLWPWIKKSGSSGPLPSCRKMKPNSTSIKTSFNDGPFASCIPRHNARPIFPAFFVYRENHQVKPAALGGVAASVRLLLTKNPVCSLKLSKCRGARCLVWTDLATPVDLPSSYLVCAFGTKLFRSAAFSLRKITTYQMKSIKLNKRSLLKPLIIRCVCDFD